MVQWKKQYGTLGAANVLCNMVGTGLEPATSRLWAWRATVALPYVQFTSILLELCVFAVATATATIQDLLTIVP